MVSYLQTPANELLTLRQIQCAQLAAKGMSSKEIARQLNISPSTVDSHIAIALVRFNLKKRSELMNIFKDEGALISENHSNNNSFMLNSNYFPTDKPPDNQSHYGSSLKSINHELRNRFYFISSLSLLFWVMIIVTYFIFSFYK